MTLPALSDEDLESLKQRHVAFLAERLVGDRARADWARHLEAGYDHVLTLRVRDLLDPAALTDALAAALTEDAIKALLSPIARDVNRRALASARANDDRVGDYVPPDARAAIDAILARPDLVPERLVRRVFEQDATEEVLRDVLYDALKEFNDTVNPFFADWGLPALLKRFVPIGGGAVLKSLGAVRAEFDKRLDPEIRKFLLVFSRKAKGKIADFVIAKSADPQFVALRKSLVAFLYEQTVAQVVGDVDAEVVALSERAAEAVTVKVLRSEATRARLRAALDEVIAEHGDATLGAALEAIGVRARPDFEALAALTWPVVATALASPVARAFFAEITGEFYDSLRA